MAGRFDYDVLVIGSGFGGSVTALRLTEKGYRVGVLEAGRRFADHELATSSWHVRQFLWAPRLGCYGIQRIHLLHDVVVLAGAGVGGGSLNYANTLYEPPAAFYADPQWAHITDWRAELAPYYDQARRMLGVVTNPTTTRADELFREVAEDMGVGETFRPTPVGVFFGRPGVEVADPYFGGAGPRRTGCRECGECMTGCRHNAKNTLVKNYLYLAERNGATVHPMTTVTAVRPLDTSLGASLGGSPGGSQPYGGYAVDTVRTGPRRRERRTLRAEQVVFAAGTHGTQRLLHRMRDERLLPHLSPRLGELTRTNSESILGAQTLGRGTDFTRGVAITSSFHPDEHTHIEPVRYGRGSNAMGLLSTFLTEGGSRVPRWAQWLGLAARHPLLGIRLHIPRRWSERTIIALVMQSLDNSITTYTRRGLFGRRLTSRQGHGEPNPSWIPAGTEAVRRLATKIGGYPGGSWGEIANIPLTAHLIGGVTVGESAECGVIDPYHRVYGHPGLHVVDGSAISANLGVNPALTITAQAERAMAFWPNRGEPDRRPAPGTAYRRLAAVPPGYPAVPAAAPAALRLPIADVRRPPSP
ncbi:MAG TPA: GMC family oxidoreductase [Mycobacteriales bacterium]|nr:GMC family oxidoreductase [Mycobacteriales bacterium]